MCCGGVVRRVLADNTWWGEMDYESASLIGFSVIYIAAVCHVPAAAPYHAYLRGGKVLYFNISNERRQLNVKTHE